ncbi:MAG: terminase large subunit [Lachnospiraceae bacterium]|nr:terminase large subunit [Lachnospiraceae bacterium]
MKIEYPADYNPILEYWEKIQRGGIPVCRKTYEWYKYLTYRIENPIPEMHYSSKRANHVLEFAENYCCISTGKYAGKPVVLELWEKAHLAAVFGFVDDNGYRTCRQSILIVGKKNGKSLLASVVGLYTLLADGEKGPQIYSAATKRDQAKIIWQESVRMIRKSPSLAKRCKPHVGDISSEAYNNGVYKPLASDTGTIDGLNVHCALLDEIHQWKNGQELFDMLADGVSARLQPLIYVTSTAGTVRQDIYDAKYEESGNIINGLFDDEGYKDLRVFPFIYELDERKEWPQKNCWIKANPNLGITKTWEYLEGKVNNALKNPAHVKNLVCKEFNIRETSSEAWLTFEQLNNTATFDLNILKPRYGIGGCDLSSTTDLTNATVIFMVPDNPNVYVLQMYWIPEDLLERKVREDKIPYDLWAQQGLLRTCPGNRVHYKYVKEWFEEIQNENDIFLYKCGYDSWSATYFVEDMKNTFGAVVMEPIIQGKKTLSSPMKSLGADLEKKKVVYNNNPILKWCLTNTSVDIDKNDNIQPSKGNLGTKRIDGLAGLLDAYVCLENNLEEYQSMI